MRPDASLLEPIPRRKGRASIGWKEPVPFIGKDYWNAYEFSFLDANGIPKIAILTIEYPSDSPYLIESKSLKVYLNSYAMCSFGNIDEAVSGVIKDLSAALETDIDIYAEDARKFSNVFTRPERFSSSDEMNDMKVNSYEYSSEILTQTGSNESEYFFYSDLLRSNCPLTGQPDWGSVYIYFKPRMHSIEPRSLLKYIVSYRTHQEFHEECCERILYDIIRAIEPKKIAVLCKYTRRGGIDINPLRLYPQDFSLKLLPDDFTQLIYTRDFRQ